MPFTFKTYTVRILGPDTREEVPASEVDVEYAEVSEILAGRVFGDVEDTLNDALPDGWQAKVSEWDR